MSQCPPTTHLSLAGRPPSSRAAHFECLGPRGTASLDLVDMCSPHRCLPRLSVPALLRPVLCCLLLRSPASARPQVARVGPWLLFVATRVLLVLTWSFAILQSFGARSAVLQCGDGGVCLSCRAGVMMLRNSCLGPAIHPEHAFLLLEISLCLLQGRVAELISITVTKFRRCQTPHITGLNASTGTSVDCDPSIETRS